MNLKWQKWESSAKTVVAFVKSTTSKSKVKTILHTDVTPFFPKDYSRVTSGTNFILSEWFTGTLTNRHLTQNSEKRLCKGLYVGDVVKSHL